MDETKILPFPATKRQKKPKTRIIVCLEGTGDSDDVHRRAARLMKAAWRAYGLRAVASSQTKSEVMP